MLLLETLLRDPGDVACVPIDPLHCEPKIEPLGIVIDQDYFRVAVSQIHVLNMSTFFREFVPVVYASVGFEFGSRKERISTVIDPRSEQYSNRSSAGLLNQHVMNPAPFTDPKVDVSLGLFRIKVADHTATVIRLLSSISSAVIPSVAFASKVAETLTKGVNDLLANKEAFVVGINESFDDGKPLKAGYRLLITNRAIEHDWLWVRDGQLYYGDDPDTAFPYDGDNYLLYRIERVATRTDYRSVEAVRQLYDKALKDVREGNGDSLTATYKELVRAVSSSVEFTLPDIKRITVQLHKELDERWKSQKVQDVAFKAGGGRYHAEGPDLPEVTEEEYAEAREWSPA
jgi:hypothetical protein